jgi:hypothetical protein
MKADPGQIAAVVPPTSAIPRFRFLHQANASSGSSGGPCFDKEFELFGLHQGVWQGGGDAKAVINRGVPIMRVLEHAGPLPGLDPSEAPTWNLGPVHSHAPVIGTEPFQEVVWRAVSARNPRLILIRGGKGSGKTFCIDVLSAMLAEGAHLKIVVSAGLIGKQDPVTIAATLCNAASAPLDPITPLASCDSTLSVWLRDHVAAGIVRALDRVRGRRTVWLCIRELNHFDIDADHASDLLLLLYEATRDKEWFRVVLDGMQGSVPETVADVTEQYDVRDVKLEDVKTLIRRYDADLQLGMPGGWVSSIATPAFANFVRDRAANPVSAMQALVEDIGAHVNAVLEVQ